MTITYKVVNLHNRKLMILLNASVLERRLSYYCSFIVTFCYLSSSVQYVFIHFVNKDITYIEWSIMSKPPQAFLSDLKSYRFKIMLYICLCLNATGSEAWSVHMNSCLIQMWWWDDKAVNPHKVPLIPSVVSFTCLGIEHWVQAPSCFMSHALDRFAEILLMKAIWKFWVPHPGIVDIA